MLHEVSIRQGRFQGPLQGLLQGPLPGLLEKTVAGLWFLRNELAEYMDEEHLSRLVRRVDEVYERALLLLNHARPFTPSFRFRLDEDDESAVHLQMRLPGVHFHQGAFAGEIRLRVAVSGTRLTLSLASESEAHALARSHRWKASEVELAALDELIDSAMRLKTLARSFPVAIAFTDHGVEIGANYHDPAAPARAALASAQLATHGSTPMSPQSPPPTPAQMPPQTPPRIPQ